MPSSSSSPRLLRILATGTLLALGACQGTQSRPPAPPPEIRHAEISNEFTATAQVVALAPAERVATLRREDGTSFDVQAGEGVRNFDQIAVGDELRVRYKEVLAATKLSAGEVAQPAQAELVAARAKAGAKPGGGMSMAVSVRVRIESLDLARNIAVFSLASGELLARRIQTAQGREFAAGLAVGDIVQLDYAQVLALAVEKL